MFETLQIVVRRMETFKSAFSTKIKCTETSVCVALMTNYSATTRIQAFIDQGQADCVT